MGKATLAADRSSERYEALDGLRGIAAFTIMLFHYSEQYFQFAAYLAVDFFLVLSGFIICHAYYFRDFSMKRFIQNRFARMWPLHLLTLVLMAIGFFVFKGEIHVRQFVMQLTLTNNMGFGPSYVAYNGAAWTIPVEFWANVLIAIVFLALPFLRQRVSLLYALAGSAAVLILAFLFAIEGHLRLYIQDLILGVNLGFMRCLASFLLGVVVYAVYKKHGQLVLERLTEWHGWVILVLFMLPLINPMPDTRLDFIAPAFFSLTVLYFATASNAVTEKIAWFKYLGKISFSLYLVHMPVLFYLHWTLFGSNAYQTINSSNAQYIPIVNTVAIFVSLIAAVYVNKYFEEPSYKLLKSKQGRSMDKRSETFSSLPETARGE